MPTEMEHIFILIFGGSWALLTFYANNKLQLGGVMASAGVSVLAAIFFKLFPEILSPNLTETIPFVAMGASFVGMASSRVIKNSWMIGMAGLLFSFLLLTGSPFFEGFGGSLGTSAAIALGSVYGLNELKNKCL